MIPAPPTPSENPFGTTAPKRALPTLIAALVMTGIAAWPVACQALGLGALTGEVVIGEALQLEVPLTGAIDRPLENECISVRRTADSIDPEYFPRDLVARVDRQTGTPRILLASRSAVRQPLVEFRIFVSCGYNLSHDYLLMAAPRSEPVPATVAAPAAVAANVAQTPAAKTAPAAAAPGVMTAPVVGTGNRLPDGIAGKNIVLGRDMTLEQLAQQHFPGPLRQQRFMRWVVEANPQYFAGTGRQLRLQRLQGGTSLVIPGAVPPRRPGDHLGDLTPLGEKVGAGATDASAPPARKPQASADGGATRTAGNGGKDRLVVGGGSSARNLKEAVALVDQLTGMMEKQLNAQTAYNEKIQQLEATVEDLGKQLKNLETQAGAGEAQWQAERQAEKTAREQEAEREWWKLLAAVVAGGLVGGGVLLGLKTLFSRKRDSTDEGLVVDLPIEAEAAPVTVAAPPKAGPLTEFGWDDDPRHAAPAAQASAPAAPKAAEVPQVSHAAAIPAVDSAPGPAPTVHHIDFEMPAGLAAATAASDPGDPAAASIELANIMTSMGLAESAAQTLVEHIRENPRESLPQWLKLLEIHRLNGNRSEFERSATELRQHFNVQPEDWSASGGQGRTSLESYPHIRSQIVRLWRKPDCLTLLRALLLDNREGTRIGFPLAVAEEILLLVAILNGSK